MAAPSLHSYGSFGFVPFFIFLFWKPAFASAAAYNSQKGSIAETAPKDIVP